MFNQVFRLSLSNGIAAQGFTSELTDDPTWMVDPVDGTTNFVHRFPFVCVCIGLAINKKVLRRSNYCIPCPEN